jgi:hypothetical protein
MALGARMLAMVWDAAWAAGSSKTNRGHYEDPNFVRSVTVAEIEQEIANPATVSGGRSSRRRRTPAHVGDTHR